MKVQAILTKPLDGQPEGTSVEYEEADFDQLKAMGAVRLAADKPAPAPAPVSTPAPAAGQRRARA
ncbi:MULTISPECIES: hypothetical protein [Sphingomonas]|jgi:hypothetical protein|uniref:Uncharacterized protein n=1 Tax=Sphingomonas zeae TaxID=1646122 RepID=A0A7Y6B228_9SPHN|nr:MULTISPECIES: hypothetical protein [Sphingomonas]MBB4049617.1 hypothetical protein [Sphingomonas zeae]MDK8188010.1 hypothetical protein [Sphingomonas zeae]MDK8217922.1 hypothetical protein [Sphingomonas sp. UMB7805-LC452B]NUU45999.1 hypothetical protein [Sphingomonas zeae]